jgi:hypothetical protein
MKKRIGWRGFASVMQKQDFGEREMLEEMGEACVKPLSGRFGGLDANKRWP